MRIPLFSDSDVPASEARVLALLGFLCGCGIAVAGWSVDLVVRGLTPTLEHLALLHATNPLHWLLDLAAPFLASAGFFIGRTKGRSTAEPSATRPPFDLAAHVLSYTTEALLVLDPDGRIVTASPAVERIFGWEARAMTGQAADLVLCDYFDGRSTPRPVHDSQGTVIALEWLGEAQLADGGRIPVAARIMPGPAPEGLRVVSLRLANERAHQTREIDQLDRLRREPPASAHEQGGFPLEFFARQVHELRNPLSVITALSAFVLEQLEQRGIVDLLQDIRDMVTASDRLQDLVDRTLDLSKIEAGRMSVLMEPVKIRPLVEELVQQSKPLAAERRNLLKLECAADAGIVFADPMRLRQVLATLLSNACKFTRDGQITLAVSHRDAGDDPGGLRILFQVRDTGIGMSKDQLGRVGDEFIQATSITRRRYGGSGLGLTLVSRLAQMMNGVVLVESVEGKGSVFTLELPASMNTAVVHDSAA